MTISDGPDPLPDPVQHRAGAPESEPADCKITGRAPPHTAPPLSLGGSIVVEALEIAAAHGCHPLRGVATYRDVHKLTYVRGPSGIIVMLAHVLQKT